MAEKPTKQPEQIKNILGFFPVLLRISDMAAGLLSLFPTLILGEHHGTNGKQSIDKEPIDSVTKKDVTIASHLSHGDSLGAFHYFPVIYRASLEKM